MSEKAQKLSFSILDAFAEIIGLAPDDERFREVAELVSRYHLSAESLYDSPLDNSVAPALLYQPPHKPPPPQSSEDGIRFDLSGDQAAMQVPERPARTRPPAKSSDLAFLPVSTLARLVAARQVSPVELTELYLSRLEGIGGDLFCVVTLTRDLAMSQARKAEAEIAKDRYRGPLHGIPWGAKDLLATKGIATTWGATPFRDQVPDHNAAVVDCLADAGAVLAAKLSMGSLAYGANWFGGMTRNPWNPETDSSGSSAGPGAATAAGLVGFSIGTETRGSILSPSHRCGVAGLRPTFGRVSRFGAMALAWSMDKIGPMCRSVEDCAAVFAAIAGPDDRDSTTSAAPFVWPDPGDLSSLHVGYIESEFDEVQESDASIYRDALDTLRDQGISVDPVKIPPCPPGLLLTLWAEAAAAFDDFARSTDIDLLKEHDNSKWADIFRAARSIPAVAYLRAQRVRTQLISEFCELMKDWDAIIAPGTGEASLTITNLTGHPALSVPCGFVDGMPRGMTLIGRLWEESTILKIGQTYETATSWHNAHPELCK